MLALFGLCTILVMLTAILTNRLSAMNALILVPCLGALAAGYTPEAISGFVLEGLRAIVPAAAMFVFSILFFGVMSDAGMLDPIVGWIIRQMGNRPTRVTMGSTLLALLIHLEGSGAVTVMLAVPALLPVYERLRMDPRVLALCVSLAAGVNVLPWSGPIIRSAAVMHFSAMDIFWPLIPVQGVGLVMVFAIAWFMGKREERRLGRLAPGADLSLEGDSATGAHAVSGGTAFVLSEEKQALRRPRLFWVNIALSLLILGAMMSGALDAALAFMLGTVAALIINCPDVEAQGQRVNAHAKTALLMASLLMSAGVFVGIFKHSGMLAAMTASSVAAVPAELVRHIPFALALISTPLSLFFDPDSFYFGVMPVLADVYGSLGGNPLDVTRAALIGVATTGFPATPLTSAPLLMIALCRISLADHQKFTLPWLWLCSIVMTLFAALVGVFPW